MGKKKPSVGKPNRLTQPPAATVRSSTEVRVRPLRTGGGYELVHPRCVLERTEDLVQVQDMIAHGEYEIAMDELRWLLNGCSDFIGAHRILGELAMADADIPLARGHFGYAFEIGSKAVKQAGMPSPLPYSAEANQAFIEAGKGLVFCLKQLGKEELARQIVEQLLYLDPTDPLGVKGFLTPSETGDA